MPNLYYLNVTIHVLAAMLWLGGMFFLGVVAAPLLRAIEPPDLRQLRGRAALFARVNAIVGVLLVAAAVRLARGG